MGQHGWPAIASKAGSRIPPGVPMHFESSSLLSERGRDSELFLSIHRFLFLGLSRISGLTLVRSIKRWGKDRKLRRRQWQKVSASHR